MNIEQDLLTPIFKIDNQIDLDYCFGIAVIAT